MSGNDDKVLLDLNYPAFQSELFEMDAPEIKNLFKTFKGISNNPNFLIPSEARNLLFIGSKKQIPRPAASE